MIPTPPIKPISPLVGFLLLVLLTGISHAAPRLLPFQGHLANETGEAINGEAKVVQFKIYDAPVSGTVVWAGEVHKLSVNQGLVNTVLGTKTAFPDRYGNDKIMFSEPLYLEITVDAQATGSTGHGVINAADPPLLPRQVILPANHALQASTLAQAAVDAIKQDIKENLEARNSENAGPPGKIIALAQFASEPDQQFWRLCDGVTEIPVDSRLGQQMQAAGMALFTPNLSDDRFLMGGNGEFGGASDDGGHNDGHMHSFILDASASGEHGHSTLATVQWNNHGPAGAGFYGSGPYGERTDGTGGAGQHQHSVGGSIGVASGPSGDNPGTNRPKYFKVSYYIKIN